MKSKLPRNLMSSVQEHEMGDIVLLLTQAASRLDKVVGHRTDAAEVWAIAKRLNEPLVPEDQPILTRKVKNIRLKRIVDLGLSNRSANCCRNASVWTLGDLADLEGETVSRWRGLGIKSFLELHDVLQANGLNWRPA